MGIYDREYTKYDEATGRGGAGGLIRGHSTVAVCIGINIVVFILWHVLGRTRLSDFPSPASIEPESLFMWRHFTVSADGVLNHFRVHTLFTSAFSHEEPWHIFWNMLFLWWFGSDLEEIYGPRDFALLYLFAGGVASLAHVGMCLATGWDVPALGASGSVMGIVIVCACFFPDRQMLMMGIIPIKLKWLAIFYVVMDLIPILDGKPTGVAHAAHLGGAAMGYLYYRIDLRFFPVGEASSRYESLGRTLYLFFFPDKHRGDAPRLTWWQRLRSTFRRRPRLRVVARRAPERPPEPPPPAPRVDSETAERVDRLLKKISDQGIGSLTPEERNFLEASSAKYRR